MAIRKDLDDMLNILKNGQSTADSKKKSASASASVKTRRDSKIDNMSVDDLLSTLAISKVVEETAAAKSPEIKPKEQSEVQEKPRKKRIVITGELPDYEALREQELERERLERERIEAEKRAAEKAERDRIKAEKARAEAEKQAAEESKSRLMAERRAAETARIEAERKAEIARIAAEKKAAEQAKLEAQRKAAEEARLEAERKAAEEARLESERKAEEKKRLEAERKAAEEARIEAERQAAKQARLEAERKEAEKAEALRVEEEQNLADSDDPENAEEPSVDELMDAAIAAAKAAESQFLATEKAAQELSEYDPVENMIDHIRGDAEKAVEEIENPPEPENPPEDSEPVSDDRPPSLAEIEAELDDDLFGGKKKKKRFGRKKDETETVGGEIPEDKEKPTSKLHKILDEDPDEIIAGRRESVEGGDDDFVREGGKLKKTLYIIFGAIFFLLACIGLITVIAKTVSFFGRYSSGDTHKSAFSDVVYPAVIMDIESFSEPSELPSEQIITAAVWSMIMSDNALDGYEKTFDVVKIPAADVESYAVKLFGDDIPALTHKTVGPAESRFYYNEDTQSYNVSVSPVTYTYSPSIKSATKNGNEYTVVVDYIDELPEWLPETSSKKVEFTLAETNDGYRIRAMKILSTSSNSL